MVAGNPAGISEADASDLTPACLAGSAGVPFLPRSPFPGRSVSVKASILATAGLLLLGCGGGLGFLATLSARQAERAAEPLGSAVAVLFGVATAALWLPHLIRWQKARQADAANEKRPARRGRAGR